MKQQGRSCPVRRARVSSALRGGYGLRLDQPPRRWRRFRRATRALAGHRPRHGLRRHPRRTIGPTRGFEHDPHLLHPARLGVVRWRSDSGCTTCKITTLSLPAADTSARGEHHRWSSGRRYATPRSSRHLLDPQDQGSFEDITLHSQLLYLFCAGGPTRPGRPRPNVRCRHDQALLCYPVLSSSPKFLDGMLHPLCRRRPRVPCRAVPTGPSYLVLNSAPEMRLKAPHELINRVPPSNCSIGFIPRINLLPITKVLSGWRIAAKGRRSLRRTSSVKGVCRMWR